MTSDVVIAVAPCGCVQAAAVAEVFTYTDPDWIDIRTEFYTEAAQNGAEVRRVTGAEFDAEWRQRLVICAHDPQWGVPAEEAS